MRDNFSKNVVTVLAERVAHRCSNPDCRVNTSGPKSTETGSVRVGEAAHIKAASHGGARYDDTQTSAERSSEQNGIWLCAICAKLIDTDITAFPIELLYKWKSDAEESAKRLLGKPTAEHIPLNRVYVAHAEERRPRLDSYMLASSGGPDGHFIMFGIKNDGNEMATNIACFLLADGFEERVQVPNRLSIGQQDGGIRHEVTSSVFFKEDLKNPRIALKYKSGEGVIFESSRDIRQEQRADGNYQILEGGNYKDKASYITVELGSPAFALSSRTPQGLSDCFFINIPVVIRNLSSDSVDLEKARLTLDLPEGFQYHSFGRDFEVLTKLAGRDILRGTLQFTVSIVGRGNPDSSSINSTFEENKNKIMQNIDSAQIALDFKLKSTSLQGVEIIGAVFDLTNELIPDIKK